MRFYAIASSLANTAPRYSRFIRAIFSTDISLGHSASQAFTLEHWPKPSLSIWATISNTRFLRSTIPCGKRAKCDTLADVNSMAEAFGQAATQAPHPMQVAASKAREA